MNKWINLIFQKVYLHGFHDNHYYQNNFVENVVLLLLLLLFSRTSKLASDASTIGYKIYVHEWSWLKGQTSTHTHTGFLYEYRSQDIWLFIPFHCIIPHHFIPSRKKLGKKMKLEWCGMHNTFNTWAIFACSAMRQIQNTSESGFVHLKTILTSCYWPIEMCMLNRNRSTTNCCDIRPSVHADRETSCVISSWEEAA